MARELEGEQTGIVGALLFNASILLERARPTFGQRLLRSRAGPLAARLRSELFFRRQFASLSRRRIRFLPRRRPTSGRCSRTTAATGSPTG